MMKDDYGDACNVSRIASLREYRKRLPGKAKYICCLTTDAAALVLTVRSAGFRANF